MPMPMGMAMGPMGPFPFPLHMGHPGGAPPPAATPSSSASDKKKEDKDKDKKTRSKDKERDEEEDADWEKEEGDLDAEDDEPDKVSAPTKGKDVDDEKKMKKGEKDRGGMPGLGFFKRMTQGSESKDITPNADNGTKNGSGKKKGSGSRRVMSKAASKGGDRDLDLEDDDSNSNSGGGGRSDPYNDERRPGETSPGGKALLGLFEVLGVEAPKDQGLRSLWERMADEEVCDRIARANRRALARELRRLGLWSSSSPLSTAKATSSSIKQPHSTQDDAELSQSADYEGAVKKSPLSDAKGKNKSGLGRVLRGLDDLLQRQVGSARFVMQHLVNID